MMFLKGSVSIFWISSAHYSMEPYASIAHRDTTSIRISDALLLAHFVTPILWTMDPAHLATMAMPYNLGSVYQPHKKWILIVIISRELNVYVAHGDIGSTAREYVSSWIISANHTTLLHISVFNATQVSWLALTRNVHPLPSQVVWSWWMAIVCLVIQVTISQQTTASR